jgi:DNA polymerase elongation subunit (family B)
MKILLLDIETSPNLAYVWRLFKQNISLPMLAESGYILCWAAKWLGSDEVMFDSVYNSRPKRMLKRIHSLLESADAVIHYNGTSFDIPTLNKEFLLHKMTPPSTYRQIDLYLTAKSRFRFPSNKLEYIAKALGLSGKFKHSGFELWERCMKKDPDAWKEMQKYNEQDVILLEEVYQIFLPWIRNHPNVGLYSDTETSTCPNCGSSDLVRRGFTYTSVGKYQRYNCTSCGTWSRDRRSVKSLGLTGDRA